MRMRMKMRAECFLVVSLILATFTCAVGVVVCRKEEREALLDFKLSFTADPHGTLSDWTAHNPDCCLWYGVGCDYTNGHVVELEVRGGLESHQLRSSLLELKHLTYLGLSANSFTMRIPGFLGSLTSLTGLDAFDSGFFGKIPPCLGNLTNLQFLFLGNGDSSYGLLYADNLQWLSHLTSLNYLEMGGTNLTSATDWVSTLTMLPSLSRFSCPSCSLPSITPSVSSLYFHNRSTSLQILELSNNNISPLTFSCLINGSINLNSLTLTSMNSEQNVHEYLEHLAQDSRCMQNLESLTISYNVMNTLPDLSNLSSLTLLDASFNGIHENFHSIVQHLPTSLTHLDFFSNFLYGVVSDPYLSKFPNLQYIDLSYNHFLRFNFSRSWVPPFQLDTLSLRSCTLGPLFPNWILTQKHLSTLDISNSSLVGHIPMAFWNGITNLGYLNVSHNKLEGTLPNLSERFPEAIGSTVDLSFNGFHGPIPLFLCSGEYVDSSNNNFSSFSKVYHKLLNNFPRVINLSNNLLLGSLPGWIFHFNGLQILNVANNMLSGDIPSSIASSWELTALHMNNNRFSGELPLSMKNCTRLLVLELGNNNFTGSVPLWIGENLQRLFVLNLRSNNFTGELPSKLCNLQRLQVLDLSGNRLSGSIPGCVDNFTSMTMYQGFNVTSYGLFALQGILIGGSVESIDYASIMWKGILANESVTNAILPQLNIIDLSSNYLTGKIPSGFTTLKYLKSLDLSSNNLNGSIPDKIGYLKYMEVLILSSNKLSGEIPQSLADLTFLNTLNLSSNNLSGEIPKSTQLQSLDPSSYGANPELCGVPLSTKCPWDKDTVKPPTPVRDHAGEEEEEEEEGHETFDFEAFYAALGAGFASGLFGVLGILNFHAPSRHAFFHMASEVGDWIFVWTFLCKSRIKRRICFSKAKEAAAV